MVPPESSLSSSPSATAGVRILIVDDDEDMRYLATILIRRLGFDTVPARNGAEALAAIEGPQPVPGIVVIDYRLPPLTGIDVWKQLQAVQAGLKGILMSGSPQDGLIPRLAEQNGLLFLEKPFSIQQLVEALRALGLSTPDRPASQLPGK